MSDDYRVNRRSDHFVRDTANRIRSPYGEDGQGPVDIIKCLESGWVVTNFGKKQLVFRVVDDHELADEDARTEHIDGKVVVTVKRSVRQEAEWGNGRARMTLAHELGHAVLHGSSPKSRRSGAESTTALSRISPNESAEHQAKVFASAFLIDDEIAAGFTSAEELSVHLVVSLKAAKICLDRLAKTAARRDSGKRVQQINEKLQTGGEEQAQLIKYIDACCPGCGNETLTPLGVKYVCHSCPFVGDLPDGDRLGS